MKKFAFITLLCISVTAIAVTSGNSQKSDVYSASFTNIADTTPKTHKTVMKKASTDTAAHKKTMVKTKMKTKPTKDSTNKK